MCVYGNAQGESSMKDQTRDFTCKACAPAYCSIFWALSLLFKKQSEVRIIDAIYAGAIVWVSSEVDPKVSI